MRIGIRKGAGHRDLRQRFGAHLNIEAFRPLDLLSRLLDVGVALQRGQDRLIERETRDLGIDADQLSA